MRANLSVKMRQAGGGMLRVEGERSRKNTRRMAISHNIISQNDDFCQILVRPGLRVLSRVGKANGKNHHRIPCESYVFYVSHEERRTSNIGALLERGGAFIAPKILTVAA